MEKKFSKIEISTIKSVARNAAQFVNKKQKFNQEIADLEASKEEAIARVVAKIDAKIAEKENEKAAIQDIIDSMQIPVKKITGGYTTEDLVDQVIEGTGKIDSKTGKEVMQTRYTLKYPETVVPPTTEGCAGSDFDVDAAEHSSHEESSEEMPEELQQEAVEAAEAAADADPFGDVDVQSNW